MDLKAYKRRLGTRTPSEALVNASIQQIKSMFTDSPLYQEIKIDGLNKGVRVNYDDENQRQLLLQPNDSTEKGAIAEFDNLKWLVTEYKPDIVYPKAIVTVCNQIAKWNDGVNFYEYPVVAIGKGYKLNETNMKYMRVAEGDITIKIPYNSDTKTIKESQRFIFGDRAYEVVGVDDISNVLNSTGILEVTLEITSTSSKDDLDTDVADNDNSSGWGGGW